MPNIGSRKHAEFILNWFETTDEWWEDHNQPEGWSKVGSGSYRAVFLHNISNVVYKLDVNGFDPEYDRGYDSRQEISVARRLSKRAFSHVRIPKTSGYTFGNSVVVAMEYISGEDGNGIDPISYREGLVELFRIGFRDMHEWNFMVDGEGFVTPIDMASPVSSRELSDIRVLSGLPEYDAERRRRGW